MGSTSLSVGAVLGLCSVLTAQLLVNEGWGLWGALPLVIVTGVLFGAIQGAISTKFRNRGKSPSC